MTTTLIAWIDTELENRPQKVITSNKTHHSFWVLGIFLVNFDVFVCWLVPSSRSSLFSFSRCQAIEFCLAVCIDKLTGIKVLRKKEPRNRVTMHSNTNLFTFFTNSSY